VEPGSHLLHIGPSHLVVIQAAGDVGALWGNRRECSGVGNQS
jgi:hypothetical protein